MSTKKCTKCGEDKTFSEFNKDRTKKDGRHSNCKECKKECIYKWRANNLEKHREWHRKWRKAHPERRWHSVNRYKDILSNPLPDGWFQDQLEIQDGTCAICDQECSTHSRLSIDHCHETGDARGLLCNLCNVKLEHMSFEGEQLDRAEDYLANPPANDNLKTEERYD